MAATSVPRDCAGAEADYDCGNYPLTLSDPKKQALTGDIQHSFVISSDKFL